ncbi:BLUF domain-containing protein [Beijerinckia sp. L45]|uniref:BLUF domain-containing protein n=1 Tax=Beijerinckia sp. L45 TaxID=1641855 RepID=UPI00131DF53C|nr:BLUF domain-containing protein [Beijerinckia sp. L45]
MVKSLLYVSRSLVASGTASIEIDGIAATSIARNRRLGVTGILLATPSGFAQILEGEAASIDEVFGSILRDVRHKDVTVLSYEPVVRRRFERWSLPYFGRSSYVAGHLEPFLAGNMLGATEAEQRLMDLMYEFGRPIEGVP